MKKFIIPAVVVLAALGVWQRDAIRETWETRGMTEDEKLERELEDMDDEFDDDIDDLEGDLEKEEASDSDELDTLEAEE